MLSASLAMACAVTVAGCGAGAAAVWATNTGCWTDAFSDALDGSIRGQQAMTSNAAKHPAIAPAANFHTKGRVSSSCYCIRLRQRVRLS